MSLWIGMLASARGVKHPEFLADTSALSRFGHHPGVREALEPHIREANLAWTDPTRLEMGVSARDLRDHEALGSALDALTHIPMAGADFARAWEVQALLVARGQHRGVALPDLLVAACAERHGLTVIHCDADFDLIGEVTGQPMRWAVDRQLL